ncbi:Transcriptional regulator of competence genes, TfoX/Sxy family [Chitinophaga eiseniae]|uniref:Transcriptional regulator of competence genes, TfoX/Sxy family n=1 Tax=Chitinophaga eiseniae TaxID=634771 RepID=A0A1T4STB0_9BACT|nr:TfoX/Sxy family protein [Chitinophaga eiseniae]SKA31485.1 Transcriptional regulator of competence genes, TfoX/Sxy family [Chitinophaga eiseniae]
MAFDEKMADRVRELIAPVTHSVEEKKMFGGLCFMVDDKMCVGVKADQIMLRIDPELTDGALEEEGCTPMVHGGKIMPGFIFVDNAALHTQKQLAHWVNRALAYNKFAAPSKKKKTAAKRK